MIALIKEIFKRREKDDIPQKYNPENITFSKSIYIYFIVFVAVVYIMDILFKAGIAFVWMKDVIWGD
jgi:hypothetical protein